MINKQYAFAIVKSLFVWLAVVFGVADICASQSPSDSTRKVSFNIATQPGRIKKPSQKTTVAELTVPEMIQKAKILQSNINDQEQDIANLDAKIKETSQNLDVSFMLGNLLPLQQQKANSLNALGRLLNEKADLDDTINEEISSLTRENIPGIDEWEISSKGAKEREIENKLHKVQQDLQQLKTANIIPDMPYSSKIKAAEANKQYKQTKAAVKSTIQKSFPQREEDLRRRLEIEANSNAKRELLKKLEFATTARMHLERQDPNTDLNALLKKHDEAFEELEKEYAALNQSQKTTQGTELSQSEKEEEEGKPRQQGEEQEADKDLVIGELEFDNPSDTTTDEDLNPQEPDKTETEQSTETIGEKPSQSPADQPPTITNQPSSASKAQIPPEPKKESSGFTTSKKVGGALIGIAGIAITAYALMRAYRAYQDYKKSQNVTHNRDSTNEPL